MWKLSAGRAAESGEQKEDLRELLRDHAADLHDRRLREAVQDPGGHDGRGYDCGGAAEKHRFQKKQGTAMLWI